jgi:hypothetical protein
MQPAVTCVRLLVLMPHHLVKDFLHSMFETPHSNCVDTNPLSCVHASAVLS